MNGIRRAVEKRKLLCVLKRPGFGGAERDAAMPPARRGGEGIPPDRKLNPSGHMVDKKSQTIHTYNTSAAAMANKFNAIGARVADIAEVFARISKSDPFVLEIGCGNGRDAQEISKRTKNYLGLDASPAFIEIARAAVPGAKFEVADVEEYAFPKEIDAVIAFASLIHTPKEVLATIFGRIHQALVPGGLFRLSMKFAPEYMEVTKESEFGIRTYYHYSKTDLEKLTKDLTVLKSELHTAVGQQWVEMLLQKK